MIQGIKKILVTGGAGYVGSELVPVLLQNDYQVNVLDLFLYGEDVLDPHTNLDCIRGDIRDASMVKQALQDVDAVIHLACISNDPSFELNPQLGKSINYDAFRPLVEASLQAGVQRFIYASSSSVYGVKNEQNVHEEMSLEPLTDYSKFKAQCEKVLNEYQSEGFTTCTLRPATVCGYSRRQRLDVIVNILSNLAYHTGEIKIFGGKQLRPNIHIQDMVRAYLHVLQADSEMIAGQVYNIGDMNYTVEELAFKVKEIMGESITLKYLPTDDPRSYHISSKKMYQQLGFDLKFSIEQAIVDLKEAFEMKKLSNTLTDKKYFNIQTMKDLKLS